MVFEPGAEPTPSLGTRCGRATVLTRSVPLRTKREVTITVSCPRSATAGCGTGVALCAPLRYVCAERFYAGLPGATDRIRLRFSAEEAARIRRARVSAVTLTVGRGVRRRVAVR